MPHNLTDVSTFTAPVAAPADGDNDAQATFDPAFQALANRTRMLLDRALGGVTSWPRLNVVRKIGLSHARPNDVATYWGFTGSSSSGYQWVSDGTSAQVDLVIDAGEYLRTGETITSFAAFVKPGNARTGSNKVAVSLYYVAHDILSPTSEPVAPTLIATKSDDGTSNKQLITPTSFSHVVDRSANDYFFVVTSGGSVVGPDRLYGLQITVTDPGVP